MTGDERIAYSKQYYRDHREEMKNAAKKYRETHKKQYAEWGAAYRKSHKKQTMERLNEWKREHPDKIKEYGSRANRKMKERVLAHYGNVCVGCGESDFDVLTIDHINGGGTKHIRSLNVSFYAWLIKNNFPPGYRTLCWNCNAGRAKKGIPLPNERKLAVI